MEAWTGILGLIQWLFGAAGVGIIAFGGMDLGRGFGETGTGEDKRNGFLKIAGGAAVIALGTIIANQATPPSL